MVAVVSCKKKTPENIGLPYLPAGDLLNANFTDTFTLITHTCKGDSLQTNMITPNLLGTINDPRFGITSASIYAQFEPATLSPSFGVNPKLDSVVLSLPYYGTTKKYGSLASEKFMVHEITGAFYPDSSYYSNRSLSITTTIALGIATLTPNITDSVAIATGKLPPMLRLRLDKNFFTNFLNTSITDYTSFSTFQKTLKGLYISTASVPSSGQGAILYIDLTNTLYSHLTFYYHNAAHPTDTTFNFNVNAVTCAHFSHFDHDYSVAPDINNQINIDKDTMHQENNVYVQPMASVRTKITFPYIKHFLDDGKKAINKAELILKVDPTSITNADSIYSPPAQVVAAIADVLGPLVMPDYYEGGVYFGGTYDATNKEYVFNIARYVQQVVDGKRKNEGLYILATYGSTTANRVQFIGGNKALSGRMRLKVTYTSLK